MADFNEVIDRNGSHRQGREPRPMLRRQCVEGPLGRGARSGMKAHGLLETEGDLVVVPADDRDRLEGLDPGHDLVRIRAVPDDIAQHEHLVVAPRGRVAKAGLEGFEVGMNVREDEIAHQCSSQSTS